MRAVAENRLSASSTAFERHINRCLGCRACEPVCPAGVEYGQLLEGARATLQANDNQASWTSRTLHFILRHIWLKPARLKLAFSSARFMRDIGAVRLLLSTKLPKLISERFELALALLQSSKPTIEVDRSRRVSNRENTEGVLVFKGCVTEGLFGRVNVATAKVLEENGCATSAPGAQVCCGALHAHAGDLEGARLLAKRNIEAFSDESAAPVITNAGGCGAMLVSYSHLFEDDDEWRERAIAFSARVRDVSQQLQVTGVKPGATIGRMRVTYDASCHLINGQHAGDAPLRMLEAIPDLEFVPLTGSDRCCGGAGIYNLMETELSAEILNDKLEHVRETRADVLTTGNAGCHMQIAAGALLNNIAVRVCHPVELLAESYGRMLRRSDE